MRALMLSGIFVAGSMRSGTTLLTSVLNSASTLAGPPHESYFMANFYGARKRGAASPLLPDCLAAISALGHGGYASFCERPAVRAKAATASEPADIFSAVCQEMAEQQGKPRWIEKTPGNEFFARDILRLFPEARILYILRDYREVVGSRKAKIPVEMRSAEPLLDARRGAHLWRASVEAHLWNLQHLPRDRYASITYENLVTRPRQTFSALASFLLEDLSDSITETSGRYFYRQAPRSIYNKQGKANSSHGSSLVRQNEIGRPRPASLPFLDETELQAAREICEPYATVLGYGERESGSSWELFGEHEERLARDLTGKSKFWFGHKREKNEKSRS